MTGNVRSAANGSSNTTKNNKPEEKMSVEQVKVLLAMMMLEMAREDIKPLVSAWSAKEQSMLKVAESEASNKLKAKTALLQQLTKAGDDEALARVERKIELFHLL